MDDVMPERPSSPFAVCTCEHAADEHDIWLDCTICDCENFEQAPPEEDD